MHFILFSAMWRECFVNFYGHKIILKLIVLVKMCFKGWSGSFKKLSFVLDTMWLELLVYFTDSTVEFDQVSNLSWLVV